MIPPAPAPWTHTVTRTDIVRYQGASGDFQPIHQFQHHLLMPLIGRVGRGKGLSHAYQSQHSSVLMIEIGQFHHHVGRFGRRGLELAQLTLQLGCPLVDRDVTLLRRLREQGQR